MSLQVYAKFRKASIQILSYSWIIFIINYFIIINFYNKIEKKEKICEPNPWSQFKCKILQNKVRMCVLRNED